MPSPPNAPAADKLETAADFARRLAYEDAGGLGPAIESRDAQIREAVLPRAGAGGRRRCLNRRRSGPVMGDGFEAKAEALIAELERVCRQTKCRTECLGSLVIKLRDALRAAAEEGARSMQNRSAELMHTPDWLASEIRALPLLEDK